MLDVSSCPAVSFLMSRASRSSVGPRFSARRNKKELFPMLSEVCLMIFVKLERRDLDLCQQVCRQWFQLIKTYTSCLDRRKLDVMKVCLRNEFSFTIIPNGCEELRQYTIMRSESTNDFMLDELRLKISEYSKPTCSTPESTKKCRWKNCVNVDTYDKCEVKHTGNIFVSDIQKYSPLHPPPKQYLVKLKDILRVSSVHSLIFFECDLNEHIISELIALLKLNRRSPTQINKIIFHDVYIDATPRSIRLFQQLLFESFKVVHIVLDQVYCDVEEEMNLPWQFPDNIYNSPMLSSIKYFNVFCTLNTYDLPINSEITEVQLLNLMLNVSLSKHEM
uniref:F-box domain-containing protein n=1 Tax=Ditylenchus dipsaci TaxID=166011 RepID=A0A915DJK3_9BILA